MPKITARARKQQDKIKMAFLEILETTPIITAACQKLHIGRATYYRWQKEDVAFADLAEDALYKGRHTVNDLAESKLITKIHAGNVSAIIFWLKHNSRRYSSKVQIDAFMTDNNLTEEQKKIVFRALHLSEPADSKTSHNLKKDDE